MNRILTSTCISLLLGSLILFVGCQPDRKETPTKGHVTILVSESVSPVIKKEEETFEGLYPDAHVDLMVTSAREAITRLFNDSIMVIVSSRPLNAEERAVQKRYNVTLGEWKIAIDGIAVIVNKSNPLTQLRTTQLDSILSGRLTKWKSVGSDLSTSIDVSLPSRNTGTFEVMVTTLMKSNDTVATPAVVPKTSQEMIDYVESHSNAIGFVGINWLHANKDKVVALELADPNAPDSLGTKGKYFSPHQAYIYQRYYPLTREIYIYSKADNYGVGAGFTTFITSHAGQTIIQNEGLVPATMPIRLVELTGKNLSNFWNFALMYVINRT